MSFRYLLVGEGRVVGITEKKFEKVSKRIMSLTSKHLLVGCNVFREVNSTFKCHQGMLFVE